MCIRVFLNVLCVLCVCMCVRTCVVHNLGNIHKIVCFFGALSNGLDVVVSPSPAVLTSLPVPDWSLLPIVLSPISYHLYPALLSSYRGFRRKFHFLTFTRFSRLPTSLVHDFILPLQSHQCGIFKCFSVSVISLLQISSLP